MSHSRSIILTFPKDNFSPKFCVNHSCFSLHLCHIEVRHTNGDLVLPDCEFHINNTTLNTVVWFAFFHSVCIMV